jgi:DNA topoisomerase-1
MSAAKLASTSIDAEAKKDKSYIFRAIGQSISFSGYLKVWPEKTKEQEMPELKEGDKLKLLKLSVVEHVTTPPARYSDASLVKEMEKYGVGRPSTYAPTINTIIVRNYAQRDENKRLQPTDIAFVVTDLLSAHFKNIIDYGFTAKMETDLDKVADGKQEWQPVIAEFYHDFHDNLTKKYEEINKKDIMPEEKTDEKCDKCGAAMIVKTGRYGKFLACSAFPDCRNIKKMAGSESAFEKKESDPKLAELEKKYSGEKCEKCGSEMKVKTGKYGPFLACSGYPKCKNIKNISDDGDAVTCPICQKGKIVKKFSKRGAFYACNNYPSCKNAYWGKPTGEKCPDCGGLMIDETKSGKIKCSNKDCGKE